MINHSDLTNFCDDRLRADTSFDVNLSDNAQ
jgi:hypothetical protein